MDLDPSPILPIQLENFQLKFDNDGIDEESNNGPLDFSLHRTVGMPGMIIKNATRGRRRSSDPGKPRVKLTERETSEQRARRLEKGRERMRRLRSNETLEERAIRLLKARECQERRRKRERDLETPEERERRLSVARDRTRLRRHEESPEQREKRLRTTRDRLRFKRMAETPEERQKRLNAQKDKKRQKYHYLASEDKEVGPLYRSRKPKLEADAEKRQTRGISIKYDIIDDELDEALLQFQSPEHPGNNSPDEIRWLAEPEVCLSVDSSHAFSPDKSMDNDTSANTNFTSIVENLPKPQDIQEQISEHVSNLVMSGHGTIVNNVSEDPGQLSENHNSDDLHNAQQQRNFNGSNCCPTINVPQSENEPVQCSNNHHSEMAKHENYSPQESGHVSQYSIMDSSNVSQMQYERNLSNYDEVVSSTLEAPQMLPPHTHHHSQELCIDNQVRCHYTHPSHETHTQSSIYSNMTQSHPETPLNLHHPTYVYPRYPLPFSSTHKHDSIYTNYAPYHLEHANIKDENDVHIETANLQE